MSLVNSRSVNLLSKSMDGLWKRQEAISENIANIDTPCYRRKSVSFEEDLIKAMQGSTNEQTTQNINSTKIKVEEDSRYFYTADYNGVDIDKESLDLAKSTIQYQYAVRTINDNFSRLRYIINEGRR